MDTYGIADALILGRDLPAAALRRVLARRYVVDHLYAWPFQTVRRRTLTKSVEHLVKDHIAVFKFGHENKGKDAAARPRALGAATFGARHVGAGPGRIDEDRLVGDEIELVLEPDSRRRSRKAGLIGA